MMLILTKYEGEMRFTFAVPVHRAHELLSVRQATASNHGVPANTHRSNTWHIMIKQSRDGLDV